MRERFSIIRGGRSKPREHDLGLKPQFLDEGKDLGLSRADIEAASRVWGTITQVTGRHVELVGLFKDELEVQLGFAIKHEEIESRVGKQGEAEDKKRRKLLVGVGAIALGGVSIAALALNYYSPEKVAERARQERETREKFEKDRVLSNNPSAISVAGWRVRYPTLEQNMVFLPSDGEDKKVRVVSNDSAINFSKPGIWGTTDQVNTNIAIKEYIRLDGKAVPILKVKIIGTVGYTSSSDRFEEWILADGQSVVLLEHVKTGEITYLSINRIQSKSPAFQVEVMKKVAKQ